MPEDAAGECRRQVKNLIKFVKNVKIVEFHDHYLEVEPQRKKDSDKYKHAWYWFTNS